MYSGFWKGSGFLFIIKLNKRSIYIELLAKQLPEYRLYHSQKANKIAHYIRIPAVILGFLIALSWISISVTIRWQH
nr:Mpo1-like protein [Candidatus Coxiella mudrowiae]